MGCNHFTVRECHFTRRCREITSIHTTLAPAGRFGFDLLGLPRVARQPLMLVLLSPFLFQQLPYHTAVKKQGARLQDCHASSVLFASSTNNNGPSLQTNANKPSCRGLFFGHDPHRSSYLRVCLVVLLLRLPSFRVLSSERCWPLPLPLPFLTLDHTTKPHPYASWRPGWMSIVT